MARVMTTQCTTQFTGRKPSPEVQHRRTRHTPLPSGTPPTRQPAASAHPTLPRPGCAPVLYSSVLLVAPQAPATARPHQNHGNAGVGAVCTQAAIPSKGTTRRRARAHAHTPLGRFEGRTYPALVEPARHCMPFGCQPPSFRPSSELCTRARGGKGNTQYWAISSHRRDAAVRHDRPHCRIAPPTPSTQLHQGLRVPACVPDDGRPKGLYLSHEGEMGWGCSHPRFFVWLSRPFPNVSHAR